MTTNRQYADDEGTFGTDRPTLTKCRRCSGRVVYRAWESFDGGYEDYQYRCTECGYVWWVDGVDS
jgi:uncharacterized Zn finger protein